MFALARFGAVLAIACWLGHACGARAAADASSQAPPISVDDLIHGEGLGDAWISPNGNSVLFEQLRATSDLPVRGQENSELIRTRVFESGHGLPQAEVSPPSGHTYAPARPVYGTPWAPDGRGYLLYDTDSSGYHLAYRDAVTGRITVFGGLPARSDLFALGWAGTKVIYSVVRLGQQLNSYPAALAAMEANWREAWMARKTPITVSSADSFVRSSTPDMSLVAVDRATGDTREVAAGDYQKVEISPDGRWMAAIRRSGSSPSSSITESDYLLQVFSIGPSGIRLWRSFPNFNVRAYDNGNYGSSSIVWSPDSTRLLIGGVRKDRGGAPELIEIRIRDSAIREFSPAGVMLEDPGIWGGQSLMPFGWLGSTPVALGIIVGGKKGPAPAVGGYGYVHAIERDYGEAGQGRIDLFRFGKSAPINLSSMLPGAVEGFVPRRGSASAFVASGDALWIVAPGRAPQRVTKVHGNVQGFLGNPSTLASDMTTAYAREDRTERLALRIGDTDAGHLLVYDYTHDRQLFTSPLSDVVSLSPALDSIITTNSRGWSQSLNWIRVSRRVLTIVNSNLAQRAIPSAVEFHYPYRSRNLTGWAILPLHSSGPAPAIVRVYPGLIYGDRDPWSAPHPTAPLFSDQLLAAHGYVVILPSMPVGPGASTDMPQMLSDETVAAIDVLAGEGLVDAKRVGILGQSFGGFAVAAIISRRSDRFAAAVASAGIYDFNYMWGEPNLLEEFNEDGRAGGVTVWSAELGQAQLGEPFWRSLDAYVRNSPIYRVDQINTPLLMLHGDMDIPETSLSGADRFFQALTRAHKKAVLVHYWGEGHVADSESAQRDQWARSIAWFDHYLGTERAKASTASASVMH